MHCRVPSNRFLTIVNFSVFSNPVLLNLENLKSAIRESVHCSAQKVETANRNTRDSLKKRFAYKYMCLLETSTAKICIFCFLSHPIFHPPFILAHFLLVLQKLPPPDYSHPPRLLGALEYT